MWQTATQLFVGRGGVEERGGEQEQGA